MTLWPAPLRRLRFLYPFNSSPIWSRTRGILGCGGQKEWGWHLRLHYIRSYAGVIEYPGEQLI